MQIILHGRNFKIPQGESQGTLQIHYFSNPQTLYQPPHPLPSVSNFAIIDKDPYQITWKAKEAIHIQRLDPHLNRNIGKMFIPHCFDPLIGVKPKHSHVDHLSWLPGQ